VEVQKGQETCSFCDTVSDVVVKSALSGEMICVPCLHTGSEISEFIPIGAIACTRCRYWEELTIVYADNSCIFTFSGVDNHDSSIYLLTRTSASWRIGLKIKYASCGNCENDLPLWLLLQNKYIRQAHLV